MKKLSFAALLLAVLLLVSSCFPSDTTAETTTSAETETVTGEASETLTDNITVSTTETEKQTETETTAETEKVTEAETEKTDENDPEKEMMKKFFNLHAGYWTNQNGRFITFETVNGTYRVNFGVWNAGGPFPAGTATDITYDGESEFYYLKVIIDELPDDPEWYGEGYAAYEMTMPINDFKEEYTGKRYIYTTHPDEEGYTQFINHNDAENPYLGQVDEEQARLDRIDNFVKSHEGYWTNEDGNFMEITSNGYGSGSVFFAVWNAGGAFPGGDITSVETSGNGKFTVIIRINAVEPNEMTDGWDAYDYVLVVEDLDGIPSEISALHVFEKEFKVFVHHTNPENPFMPF